MKSMTPGCLTLVLMAGAMCAHASPPFIQDVNRNAVRNMTVSDCDGEQCLNLQAVETYDLKGDYQYASLNLSETSSSNGVFGQRWLSCPLQRGVLTVRQDAGSAMLQTSVNVADCDTGGSICEGEVCELWGYAGIIGIDATMSSPFGAYSETSHVKLRDGPDTYAATCNKNAGYSYSNISVAIDGMPWAPESSGAGSEHCNRNNRDR